MTGKDITVYKRRGCCVYETYLAQQESYIFKFQTSNHIPMKTCTALLLMLLFCCTGSYAQSARDYAVEITASVQPSPAQISLSWRPVPNVTTYRIYRKAKTASSWGSTIATLSAPTVTYTDVNVVKDSAYEYKIEGSATNFVAYGYIYAGIDLPATHNKGTLILVVDSAFTDSCQAGLYRLMKDYSGDGWQVVRHDVARTMRDSLVRELIKADYNNYPNVKAVQIIGHVAVPYSGYLAPDGHGDHSGAWPADVYYGSMTGTWTDVTVNATGSPYPSNVNVPGDGKWDQSAQTKASELQVARVDFYNMPAFNKTEIQMMRSYLNRDHQYKMDSLAMNHRGIISDNFGGFYGEAFAANGWRNFSPLVYPDSVTATSTLITDMNSSSYQWAYGCGPGYFSSAAGVGNTGDYVTNNVNGIFMMLFGSYFGDWNTQNNFLRAPLCADVPALTNCWAGRPHWFFHHMALGENIGYGARLSQYNTITQYMPYNYGTLVHIALMGDLSLRSDYINPPRNVAVTAARTGPIITWTASADTAVTGYYVYRSDTEFGTYTLLSGKLTTNSFTDSFGTPGLKYYMVRATKPEITPSGTYHNLSIGVTASASVVYPAPAAPKGVLVVTELSNGPTGDCEYAVMAVANCVTNNYADTVNIQGWIMDDNAGNFNAARTCQAGIGITAGHYRLAYDRMWSKVPVGSIIVLYNRDAGCYNLPATINGPDTNGVYWQPVGGTAGNPYYNPHIERYNAAPDTAICTYCNANGNVYTAASLWTTTVGLDNSGDAFQVRCPGCTGTVNDDTRRPVASFYHGFGYGSGKISNPFQTIPATTANLGGPVLNMPSGAGRKFYFTGLTGADLGDPLQWVSDTATATDPVGILRNGFRKRIVEHMLSLPCCGARLTPFETARSANGTIYSVPGVTAYPNPATDQLFISFPPAARVTVRLTDITGKLIDVQTRENSRQVILDVHRLSPGMYLYQVITDTLTGEGKVLITR